MMEVPKTETVDEFRVRALAFLPEIAVPASAAEEPGSSSGVSSSRFDDLQHKQWQQAQLQGAGFAGITVPVEYGGSGLDHEYVAAFSDVASRFVLPNKTFGVGVGLVTPLLLAMGNDVQKSEHVRQILIGEEMWCQLFSEPEAGSDLAGLRTTATKVEGGWHIRGQKVWTTGAHVADFGLLIARTDITVAKHAGLSAFILDMRQDGVTPRPLRQMTGHAEFNEVFLDDAWVPDDALIGATGDGWRAVQIVLSNERTNIGTGGKTRNVTTAPVALMAAAGERLADDADVRRSIARLHVRQMSIELFGRWVGEQPDLNTAYASIGKLAAARQAKDCAQLALIVVGPTSVAWRDAAAGADRWAYALLNSPANAIAGGTDEIQRNIVGERLLGLPREPSTSSKIPFNEIRFSRPS